MLFRSCDVVRRKDGYRDDGYYPGIVNISGTYCFMDSTLQALASLSYLQPHIEQIHEKAEALDVPTPVIDALLAILKGMFICPPALITDDPIPSDEIHTSDLNHSKSSPRAIRPVQMIQALVDFSRSKQNHLFSSRQHQDAQELFQLISECIKTETAAVDKEGHRDRGLGALSHHSGKFHREIGKSVFDGLTANRRSCKRCGYTEAVMHFAFDSWQLTVPRAVSVYHSFLVSGFSFHFSRMGAEIFMLSFPRALVGWMNACRSILNWRNSTIVFVGSVL